MSRKNLTFKIERADDKNAFVSQGEVNAITYLINNHIIYPDKLHKSYIIVEEKDYDYRVSLSVNFNFKE